MVFTSVWLIEVLHCKREEPPSNVTNGKTKTLYLNILQEVNDRDNDNLRKSSKCICTHIMHVVVG